MKVNSIESKITSIGYGNTIDLKKQIEASIYPSTSVLSTSFGSFKAYIILFRRNQACLILIDTHANLKKKTKSVRKKNT